MNKRFDKNMSERRDLSGIIKKVYCYVSQRYEGSNEKTLWFG